MKLRNRINRSSGVMKDEDRLIGSNKSESLVHLQDDVLDKLFKLELINGNSFNIKQEYSKDPTLSEDITQTKLEQDPCNSVSVKDWESVQLNKEDTSPENEDTDSMEFSNSEYYYCCHLCNTRFENFPAVHNHRTLVHDINSTSAVVKHMDLEPDIYDPNYSCRSCETTYSTRSFYRSHLRSIHHMVLKSIRRRPRSNIEPDIYDPNFHCRSCDRTYTTSSGFRIHIRRFHEMPLPRNRPDPNITPDCNDPNLYCASCKRKYKNRTLFNRHCRKIHKMQVLQEANFCCKVCNTAFPTKQKYRSHCFHTHKMRPVSLESNGQGIPQNRKHCQLCNKTFVSIFNCQMHLYVMHSIDNESSNQASSIKPDFHDPDYHCRVCDRTWSSKRAYKFHLGAAHSMPQKIQEKKKLDPDIDDPNNYCRACKRKFSTKRRYRSHLRCKHQIASKDYPDPLDPKWYCSVCKLHYKSQKSYRKHCRIIHQMALPHLRQKSAAPNAEPCIYKQEIETMYAAIGNLRYLKPRLT